jgi:hypothetical protein
MVNNVSHVSSECFVNLVFVVVDNFDLLIKYLQIYEKDVCFMMTCLLNAIISPVLYTITKKISSIALISYILISSDYTSAFYMITITGLQDIVYIYNVIFYCTYVLHILFHKLHQRLLHDHSYCYPSFLLLLTSYIFLSTDYTSVFCMATVTVTTAFYCT